MRIALGGPGEHHRTVRRHGNALRLRPRGKRVVLLRAQELHVVEALAALLDVPVQHGGVRVDAQLVRGAVHVQPLVAADLALERLVVHAVVEHLGAAARQAAEARLDQVLQHGLHALVALAAALGDALQVDDLHGGERLDVDGGRLLADGAQHVGVVAERKPRMQPAHDVHLGGAALARLACLGADVLQAVLVRAVLVLLAVERAELAAERADVRVVEVPVDVEEHLVAVQAPAHHVRQAHHAVDVRRGEEQGAVRGGEALARLDLARHLGERRVAARMACCRNGVGGKRHGRGRIGGDARARKFPHGWRQCTPEGPQRANRPVEAAKQRF